MALKFSTNAIARASAAHPWRTIAVWGLALVVSGVLIGALLPSAMTTESTFSNMPEARKGQQLIEDRLRGQEQDSEAVVIRSTTLTSDAPAFQAFVGDILTKVRALGPEIVAASTSAYESHNPALISDDGRTALIPITLAGSM